MEKRLSINRIFYVGILISLLTSCTSREAKLKVQQDEVMKVHDEAMAQMDALHNFEIKLREEVKVLQEDSSFEVSDFDQKQQLVYKLVKAQDAMMDWMHEYDPSQASVENQYAEVYLAGEMKKIKAVHAQMFGALKEAEEIK